jgi:hypothetical protein
VCVRQVLRSVYNNRLAPLYYNSMKRIDRLYGVEALNILKAIFKAEALLEDSAMSQRVKLLQ